MSMVADRGCKCCKHGRFIYGSDESLILGLEGNQDLICGECLHPRWNHEESDFDTRLSHDQDYW